MFSILITQLYGNLNIVGNSCPPQPQRFFSNEWGGNFKFEFCKNVVDKFNAAEPCIVHSFVLHAYLRRSQILLTFSRHQVVYSVFCIVPWVELACKGLLLLQEHCKEQHQTLVSDHCQYCFRSILHLRVYNYNFYSIYLN